MRTRMPAPIAATFFLAVLLSAGASAAQTAAAQACPAVPGQADLALSARIDPVIDAALERGFAGGVAIIKDGVLVYQRAAGRASLREDIPVTDDTLFHVASVTKYFTAALVLKAAEDNLWALEDPVARFIPDTQIAKRGVTIFDLLAHRSGLGSSYAAESETDRDKALAAIDAAAFDPDRAGQFRYSNDGYDLLGVLLERAYGRDYETLLRENIFSPACLDRPRHWASTDVADPHIVSQPLQTVSESLRKRNYGMMASAGLLVTAADLAAYQYALSNGRILSAASLEALFAPRGPVSIGEATFGAFLSAHPTLGRRLNARGYEDWGDNAILNHYLDRGVIVAVVASRGPAEETGEPPFRSQLSEAIETILAKDAAE